MRQADSEGIVVARSDLRVGQEVRVTGGSFEGVIGMLLGVPDAKGRVKVLMNLLSREIKVEIPVHMVANTWVPQVSGVIGSKLQFKFFPLLTRKNFLAPR